MAGIPKRKSEQPRPIAIGLVLMRAWHRALLEVVQVDEGADQWCGKEGRSVVSATANWAQAEGNIGAELDLSKAFDCVGRSLKGSAGLQRCTQ